MDDHDWYSQSSATFGDRLTAAREAIGLDVEGLAHRAGVKITTLQAWEDDRKEPRANRVTMLAGMLGVSLRWLLTGEGEGVAPPTGGTALEQGLSELLSDLRALRGSMARDAETLARLEARLAQLAGAPQ